MDKTQLRSLRTADGELHTAHAAKEVILSAGAIGSPQVLLTSGIGPRAELEAAAAKARELVAQMRAQQLVNETPWLLNVNIPNMPLEALRPAKLCRLGRRHAAERVIVQESPRGEAMYWIGGAGAAKDDAEGTDFHATAQGHVSITPLKVDLTDHDNLGYWAQTAARMQASVAVEGVR